MALDTWVEPDSTDIWVEPDGTIWFDLVSGPTIVTHTIKSSGGDYTTLSAWESAQQRDLVTADECAVAEVYDVDAGSVSIGGWTTDSTHYITIKAASGYEHQGKWSTSKARIVSSSSDCITINDSAHVMLEHLQFDIAASSGFFLHGVHGYDTSLTTMKNCLVIGTSTSRYYGYGAYIRQGKMAIYNSIVCDIQVRNSYGVRAYNYGSLDLFNTTIANVKYSVFLHEPNNDNTVIIKNTIAQGDSYNFYRMFGSWSPDDCNNLSENSSAPGTDSITFCTLTFTDAANGEYLLSSSDVEAIQAGADLSATFTDDILGNTRTGTWDIGAHEYQGSVTFPRSSSDGASLGDSTSGESTVIGGVEDTSEFGEDVDCFATYPVLTSDGSEFTDSPSRFYICPRSVIDGAEFSELAARMLTTLGESEEGLSFSDSIDGIYAGISTVADGIDVSDLPSQFYFITKEVTDGIDVSDLPISMYLAQAEIVDAIHLFDLPSGIYTALGITSDGFSFDDGSYGLSTLVGGSLDGVELSGAGSTILSLVSSVEDGVSITDVVAGKISTIVYVLSGVDFIDAVVPSLTAVATSLDGINMDDTSARSFIYNTLVSDVSVFSEQVISEARLNALLSDGVLLSEESVFLSVILGLAAEEIRLTDSGAVNVSFSVSCSDIVEAGDTVSAIAKFFASLSDSAILSGVQVEGRVFGGLIDGGVVISFISNRASLSFSVSMPNMTLDNRSTGTLEFLLSKARAAFSEAKASINFQQED